MASSVKDEQLEKLIGFVEEYIDATHDARELSERSRDYYDGYQWTVDEQETLRARKQPCITNNRIKPKVQFLRGMEMQTRTDPKAYPRTPDDEQSAEVSTDAIRYVSDNNRSDQMFSKGFKFFLVEGTEGHEVVAHMVDGEFVIEHNVLEWDRLIWDPHSREEDYSDARWKGTLQWMDKAEGTEEFPDAPEEVFAIESGMDGHGSSDTFEDRPSFFQDTKRQRVRVFFMYFIQDAVWHYAIFTKSGFIKRPEPSPYLDDNGQPEPQFEFQSAFVDIEGGRYGEVASYLDLQDEINKRRSKMLHLMSVRQTFSSKGSAGGDQNTQTIKSELAKPDGHVEFQTGEFGKDFGIIPTTDMTSGQAVLLTEAKQEIDSMGANAALAGTDPRQLSGRAVQSLQQGGSVEINPLFDGHRYLKNRVHRMMLNRIKQFWDEPKWIRVTDNEEKLRFTGLNRPITIGDQIEQEFGGIPPQFQNDPRLNQQVGVENPANELDVDIILDEMPDTVTIQQEQFDTLARMYEINPAQVPFELVIKASQLRNKDELLELIGGGTDEQKAALAKAQAEQQAEQQALITAAATADIQEKQAKAQKAAAEAQKTQVETQLSLPESQAGVAKDQAAANKMNQESKQIVVETAIDVQQATEPKIQVFG